MLKLNPDETRNITEKNAEVNVCWESSTTVPSTHNKLCIMYWWIPLGSLRRYGGDIAGKLEEIIENNENNDDSNGGGDGDGNIENAKRLFADFQTFISQQGFLNRRKLMTCRESRQNTFLFTSITFYALLLALIFFLVFFHLHIDLLTEYMIHLT